MTGLAAETYYHPHMLTLVALFMGVGLLWAALLIRRLEKRSKDLTAELGRIRVDLGRTQEEFRTLHHRVGEFDKLIHYGVAIDADIHERGWIIMVANVGGRDLVKIHQTKRSMSMQEYRDLVRDIESVSRRVTYVDAPNYYSEIIKRGLR